MKTLHLSCFVAVAFLSLGFGDPFPVQPFTETRHNFVVKQRYSWDCGIACVQTIVELLGQEVKPFMLKEEEKLEQVEGFVSVSLATLSDYLLAHGLSSAGYHLTPGHLDEYFANKMSPPLIIHTRLEDAHFSILVSFYKGHALILDPALGAGWIAKEDLLDIWTGYVLYIAGIGNVSSSVEPIIDDARERLDFLFEIGEAANLLERGDYYR